ASLIQRVRPRTRGRCRARSALSIGPWLRSRWTHIVTRVIISIVISIRLKRRQRAHGRPSELWLSSQGLESPLRCALRSLRGGALPDAAPVQGARAAREAGGREPDGARAAR